MNASLAIQKVVYLHPGLLLRDILRTNLARRVSVDDAVNAVIWLTDHNLVVARGPQVFRYYPPAGYDLPLHLHKEIFRIPSYSE